MKTLVTTGLAVGLTALAAAGAANAQIMLYENENFSGRNYSSTHSVSNLGDSGYRLPDLRS